MYYRERVKDAPKSHLKGISSLDELSDVLHEHPEELEYEANLEDENQRRTMKCHKVRENGNTHLILYDEGFVRKNSFSKRWFIDATFSIRPRKVGYQFLTIMCEKGKKVSINLFSINLLLAQKFMFH